MDLRVRQDQTQPVARDVGTQKTLNIATPCLETASTFLECVTARPSVSSVLRLEIESTGSVCATLQTGLAMA